MTRHGQASLGEVGSGMVGHGLVGHYCNGSSRGSAKSCSVTPFLLFTSIMFIQPMDVPLCPIPELLSALVATGTTPEKPMPYPKWFGNGRHVAKFWIVLIGIHLPLAPFLGRPLDRSRRHADGRATIFATGFR